MDEDRRLDGWRLKGRRALAEGMAREDHRHDEQSQNY
jgi:hypothetical protein